MPDVQALPVRELPAPCERLVAVDDGDVFVMADAEAGGDLGPVGEVVTMAGDASAKGELAEVDSCKNYLTALWGTLGELLFCV
jgi:hypothetical protein